ncbi:hypothetical protein HY310_03115 [Candidatus Microgenomates bacterium]|nr:hypothetical protein [Candidatus Microgenomates bacterium]
MNSISQNLNLLKQLNYPKQTREIQKLLVETLVLLQKAQTLSPRRQEIVDIIRDHQQVSADFIHRRFFGVNPRLLRYDLKYLVDNGYISKVGKTRGALYVPVVR